MISDSERSTVSFHKIFQLKEFTFPNHGPRSKAALHSTLRLRLWGAELSERLGT